MINLNKSLKEFIGFLGVGLTNTVFTYIIYLVLLLIVHYQLAYFFSYVVGIFIAYYLNLKFVFKKKSTKEKLFKFPFIYLFQYLMGVVILDISIDKLQIHQAFGPIIVVLFSLPITFFLTRHILLK